VQTSGNLTTDLGSMVCSLLSFVGWDEDDIGEYIILENDVNSNLNNVDYANNMTACYFFENFLHINTN
jgi:hypothetical protein